MLKDLGYDLKRLNFSLILCDSPACFGGLSFYILRTPIPYVLLCSLLLCVDVCMGLIVPNCFESVARNASTFRLISFLNLFTTTFCVLLFLDCSFKFLLTVDREKRCNASSRKRLWCGFLEGVGSLVGAVKGGIPNERVIFFCPLAHLFFCYTRRFF